MGSRRPSILVLVPSETPPTASRAQRVLAYMVAGLVLLSIIAFFAIIIGTFAGVDDLTEGVWPAVYLTVYLALPIAILLVIALVIASARIRAKDAATARNTPQIAGKQRTRAASTRTEPTRPDSGRPPTKDRKNLPRTNRAE